MTATAGSGLLLLVSNGILTLKVLTTLSSFAHGQDAVGDLLTDAVLTRTFPEIEITDGSSSSLQRTVSVFHGK